MSYERMLSEIRGNHTVVSYIDLITATQQKFRVRALSGDVSVDSSAAIRRSFSFSCIDPTGEITPTEAGSSLTPFGTEVRPYRGVRFADGSEYVHPLGVFRLSTTTVLDSASGGIAIQAQAYDLSRTIQRDTFISPYVVPSGTNLITAIKAIVERTFPLQEYDSITTTRVTTATLVYDVGDDPWDAVSGMALSLGCSIYFDVYGTLVIAPSEDANSEPAFTYEEGPRCTMLDLQRGFSDEKAYNGVVVVGESPADELAPVRAEAWDMDPTSPTYRFGPYGEYPLVITDSNVKTVDDAQSMADQVLASITGSTSSLSITTMVNPALEAGNTVSVRRARSHVAGVYVADAFNIPMLAAGTQGLTLREKRSHV